MNKLVAVSAIQSSARKALIAADSGYFSWSDDQQERFRATMNEHAQNKVNSWSKNKK